MRETLDNVKKINGRIQNFKHSTLSIKKNNNKMYEVTSKLNISFIWWQFDLQVEIQTFPFYIVRVYPLRQVSCIAKMKDSVQCYTTHKSNASVWKLNWRDDNMNVYLLSKNRITRFECTMRNWIRHSNSRNWNATFAITAYSFIFCSKNLYED